ncbi:hypothetical protein [Paraburkholderia fungorum]|uniref:hypothetical protein n=1 Tax=Paraburkholderia fungorum TaxID=134537 RepID=UPI0038BDC541
MSRITLTIDRLVLAGFTPAEREALTQALRTELARVLADPARRGAGGPCRAGSVVRLGMRYEPGVAGGRQLGQRVARALGKQVKS